MGQKVEYLASLAGLAECATSHPLCQSRRSSRRAAQREGEYKRCIFYPCYINPINVLGFFSVHFTAVHIEGIVLRSIFRRKIDKEYKFEVGNDTEQHTTGF